MYIYIYNLPGASRRRRDASDVSDRKKIVVTQIRKEERKEEEKKEPNDLASTLLYLPYPHLSLSTIHTHTAFLPKRQSNPSLLSFSLLFFSLFTPLITLVLDGHGYLTQVLCTMYYSLHFS